MKKNIPPSPFGYLLIIGILLVSLMYLVGTLQEWQVRDYLSKYGTLAEATLVEHSEQFRNFSVKYSFSPNDEVVGITRRESTNMFYYSTYLKHTDKVIILFDPNDPKISRIAGNNNFVAAGLAALVGIATAIYLAVRLTIDLFKLHRETGIDKGLLTSK